MELANAFILFLVAAAAWIGIAAFVQKRSERRRGRDDRSSNAAS